MAKKYPVHKCDNPDCPNMTTNRCYCCRDCKYAHHKPRGPLSDETKAKISEKLQGNTNGAGNKGQVRGPMSDDHKSKISQSNTGKSRSEETCRNISEARTGMKFSKEHRENLSKSHKEFYESEVETSILTEYQIIADELYKYQCCLCNKTEGQLVVHHIDGDHDNNDPDNLCWLCRSCHCSIHKAWNHEIDEGLTEKVLLTRSQLIKREGNYE